MQTHTGAEDYKCYLQNELLSDAKNLYGYTGSLLVNEEFKNFSDAVFTHFRLQYPPPTPEDALLLYFVLKEECDSLCI